ncbi:hypothetical protein B0H16DRAFT_1453133 [Mycena metata]|uniref:Uncharacterized protein n=1 Tax=Mycena metata TaxID=1033252 RepID=A0AAD7JNM2_9AGAR|nr:hypothetical protein B0H16DRAFT_1453133 [Mycena metata]
MDTSAIGRFHSTVAVLLGEIMDVPAGRLSRFLRQNLRFKVFLVAISILEDRWATRTRTSITTRDVHEARYYAARVRQNEFRQNFSRHNTPTQASWMFYLIGVLLYAVGFDGDDAPDVQGVNVFNLAVSQAEFFLKECAETVALFRVSKQAIFLDYEEYNPHHTVEPIFVSLQPPRNFKRIAVNDAVVLDFSTNEINSSVWTDAQRVVEATLIALSCVDGALLVETDSEGKVIGVQKESVEGLLADMVDSPPERGHQADCLQGGSRSHFCRSASPTLCADEEACGRELSEWSVPIRAAMSNVYRLPRIALDSNFYGIEEACKLVNEYALDTALRFEPGSQTRDKLDDVMERYIRPSIHLLDCALRPANTGWLRRHELTMIELIVVHDAISNIMGFLAISFTRRWRGSPQRRLQRRTVLCTEPRGKEYPIGMPERSRAMNWRVIRCQRSAILGTPQLSKGDRLTSLWLREGECPKPSPRRITRGRREDRIAKIGNTRSSSEGPREIDRRGVDPNRIGKIGTIGINPSRIGAIAITSREETRGVSKAGENNSG